MSAESIDIGYGDGLICGWCLSFWAPPARSARCPQCGAYSEDAEPGHRGKWGHVHPRDCKDLDAAKRTSVCAQCQDALFTTVVLPEER